MDMAAVSSLVSNHTLDHFYNAFVSVVLQLWSTRVEAGCQQYGLSLDAFKEGLTRSNILLNK